MVAPSPDRALALQQVRKFYVSPTPCKECGGRIKFVSSYGCHYCGKKKGRERLAQGVCEKYQTPENDKARVRRWRDNNPESHREQWRREPKEQLCARASQYRAARRNQTPDLTEEESAAIIEMYSLARRLTEETGIRHEVDHIHPISKGGLHHPDNLQVLTKHDNQVKYNHCADH